MTTSADPPPASSTQLAAVLGADVAALDRELTEIDMLVGQAKAEAARHEQKRAQLAEKLSSAESGEGADAWAQLVTLTRRSVLMEAQVDVLEGKRRALARHRDAIASLVGRARRACRRARACRPRTPPPAPTRPPRRSRASS